MPLSAGLGRSYTSQKSYPFQTTFMAQLALPRALEGPQMSTACPSTCAYHLGECGEILHMYQPYIAGGILFLGVIIAICVCVRLRCHRRQRLRTTDPEQGAHTWDMPPSYQTVMANTSIFPVRKLEETEQFKDIAATLSQLCPKQTLNHEVEECSANLKSRSSIVSLKSLPDYEEAIKSLRNLQETRPIQANTLQSMVPEDVEGEIENEARDVEYVEGEIENESRDVEQSHHLISVLAGSYNNR